MPEGNIWQLTGQRRFSIFGSNICWEQTGKSVLCFSKVVIWRADTGRYRILVPILSCDMSCHTDWLVPEHIASCFILCFSDFWNTFKWMSECYNTDSNDTKAACVNHKKSNNFVFSRFRIMSLSQESKDWSPRDLKKIVLLSQENSFCWDNNKNRECLTKDIFEKQKKWNLLSWENGGNKMCVNAWPLRAPIQCIKTPLTFP